MEASERRAKERSALYPGVPWNDALEFIKKVDLVGGKVVSYATMANAYNLTSPNNNNFTARISAAKQYGLINTEDNTIKLTESSKRLLYPTSYEETRVIQLSCFNSPPLYRKLIERFEGKALPSQGLLENILVNDYEITKNAKENAAKNFLASIEQLGFAKAGVLVTSLDNEIEEKKQEQQAAVNEKENHHNSKVVEPVVNSSDYFKLEIPLQSGKPAHIYMPIDASKEDAELIRDMLSVILRRRYGIDT